MNAHVSYQVDPVVRTKLDFHLDQAPRFGLVAIHFVPVCLMH